MTLQKLFKSLTPFVFIGIAIVAFTIGFIVLAYLFIFGAVVGIILFFVNWLRAKLATHQQVPMPKPIHKSGRVIDSDDWKEL